MRMIGKMAVAGLATVGAVRVVCWANRLMTYAMIVYGSWEPEAAAKSAPLVLFALASGTAMSLYGMYEDNKRYSRNSPYGRIERTEARSVQNDRDRKAG